MESRYFMHVCVVTRLLCTYLRHRRLSGIPGNGGICVFVNDVDGVYAELTARGANVIKPPQNYDYGMRDFDVLDLDGNHLTFGKASPS
jgi:predicted enzyme related to lactoylglutathione lyase